MRLTVVKNQPRIGLAVALWLALAASAAAQVPFFSAKPFEAVPEGFNGTKFRGVGLGQTRQEVEEALARSGFRCMTDAEIMADYDQNMLTQRIEELGGFEACRLTVASNPTGIGFRVYVTEMVLGVPIKGISFKDGIASALSLPPAYFDAEGVSGPAFAAAIVDNYPLPDGLTANKGGWSGLTSSNELVEIFVSTNSSNLYMVVHKAEDRGVPAFD